MMRKSKLTKGPYPGHNPKSGLPNRAMPIRKSARKSGGKRRG